LKKVFPLAVAVYIVLVGALFLTASSVEVGFLSPQPHGRPFLLVLSVLLIAAGFLFAVLFQRGQLKIKGKSLKQVRKEAVAKLDSESLLADIALKEDDPEIRRAARQRLQEIAG
jgi:hypothetical protein